MDFWITMAKGTDNIWYNQQKSPFLAIRHQNGTLRDVCYGADKGPFPVILAGQAE